RRLGNGSPLRNRCAVLLKEMCNRQNALIVVADSVLLVWRMQPVIGQTESHQYRGYAKILGEFSNYRNRSAAAYEHGWGSQHLAECLRRNVDRRMIGIHQDS